MKARRRSLIVILVSALLIAGTAMAPLSAMAAPAVKASTATGAIAYSAPDGFTGDIDGDGVDEVYGYWLEFTLTEATATTPESGTLIVGYRELHRRTMIYPTTYNCTNIIIDPDTHEAWFTAAGTIPQYVRDGGGGYVNDQYSDNTMILTLFAGNIRIR